MKSLVRTGLAVAASAAALVSAGAAYSQNEENDYYRDRKWSGFNGGEMNISSFVFRDMNANGKYDLGDRNFANVAVKVTGPSHRSHLVRTNISGFANFRASVLRRDREITNPGSYNFNVVVPPGWRITTGNQKQKVAMDLLLGSPGDLVATTPTEPVGLVQVPEIRGRVDAGNEAGAITVSATGPNAEPSPVSLDRDGSCVVPASPGAWLVQIANASTGSIDRRVEVRQFPVVLPLLTSQSEAEEPETRLIAGFDDLISSESVAKIPSGYVGLNWHNWVVTHNRTYSGEGYINGTMSGEYVAYNGSGHPTSIDSEQPFHFVGGYFTGAWADAEGEMLNVKAWSGDTLAHEDRIRLSAMGPVYFAAKYKDVTRVEFFTDHYWQVVADDLVFARP
jgi:hypothetical protein